MSTDSSDVDRRDKAPSLALPVVGLLLAIAMIGVGVWLAGRRNESLSTTYGRRRGSEAGKSVNGTAVLAELFRRGGHRVTTFGRLSPKLEEADAIVWIPVGSDVFVTVIRSKSDPPGAGSSVTE